MRGRRLMNLFPLGLSLLLGWWPSLGLLTARFVLCAAALGQQRVNLNRKNVIQTLFNDRYSRLLLVLGPTRTNEIDS